MRCKIEVLMTYDLPGPADILLAVQAIPMADQQLLSDNLLVTGAEPMKPVIDPIDGSSRTWFTGNGRVTVDYVAEVLVDRAPTSLAGKPLGRRIDLPAEAVPYLFPSRYCESDRLPLFVGDTFGELQGGDQVEAMADWICEHLTYTPGASTAETTAIDTFLSRRGVCRDYAHLMISFARAAGIPARAVSVYAPGLDPQDFHAVVEVYLDGAWHLVDPARMAPDQHFVRIATGRDATDISFMSIFGSAMLVSQRVNAFDMDALPDSAAA
ncbi:transglutaminase family protein [Sphingobium sufflavum]|uniref:transglutaminase-like domain-containing protein n=1 Tax=Sphingobium sufflavum TaxID=1129547 RepID=UPI001F22F5EA|nr:transglutaminase family protein [Sphingobium sufflavum]MCE7795588.1 transglutaminase family protein [Sphingobium sufflavum]